MYIHLTWELAYDDPHYSPVEPDDGSDSVANVSAPAPARASSGVRRPGGAPSLHAGNDSPTVESFRGSAAPGLTAFPLSEKEGEALKVKAAEGRVHPRTPPTTGPRPPSGAEPADGGLDAGADDVQYYYIWKKEDGVGVSEPLVILEAGTCVFDDPYVEYGHIYDYTIYAKDSENSSGPCGPISIDLKTQQEPPGPDGALASGPDSPLAHEPYHDPLDGGTVAAPFAEMGWGASGTKPAKVITCKPNPVTGTATFTIKPSKPTCAKIDIYDLAGRKVATVFDKYVTAAGATATWTPSVTPGLYLYALRIGSERHVGKVVVGR